MIFIDVEITGTEAFDEVFEIAFISLDSTRSESITFKPDEVVSDAMKQLTNITEQELIAGVSFASVDQLLDENDLYMSYHLQHDINWIVHTQKLYAMEPLRSVDGVCLSEVVNMHFNLSKGHFITLNSALSRLLTESQMENLGKNYPPHRAFNDAYRHKVLLSYLIRDGLDKARLIDCKRQFIPQDI